MLDMSSLPGALLTFSAADAAGAGTSLGKAGTEDERRSDRLGEQVRRRRQDTGCGGMSCAARICGTAYAAVAGRSAHEGLATGKRSSRAPNGTGKGGGSPGRAQTLTGNGWNAARSTTAVE